MTTSLTGRGQHSAAAAVAEHPGLVRFGKAGWFAKGVVYFISGVLALVVVGKARGWSGTASTPDQEASPTGALRTIAGTGVGPVFLWLLAGGLVLYALWRFASATLPGKPDTKTRITRIGFVISGALYLFMAVTAVKLATSSNARADGNTPVRDATASTMEHSWGRLLVGLVGVIVIAVGLYRIVKGAKNDVGDELDFSGMSSERARIARALGRVGEIGRGIGIGLVGVFLLDAALDYQAAEATGLDGALRRMATHSWGVAVVAVVGIGFVAYGAFCMLTCTHRRLQSPS